MTISLKRRRQIAQEAREFHEAWKLASAYGTAGNSEMASRTLDTVKVSKPKSPDEEAWLLKRAKKRIGELLAEDHERRMQGLPRPEPKKPPIH